MYQIFIIRLTRKKVKKPGSISARNSLSAGRAVCNSVCRQQRAGPQEVKAEVGDGGGVRSPAASAAPRGTLATSHSPKWKWINSIRKTVQEFNLKWNFRFLSNLAAKF